MFPADLVPSVKHGLPSRGNIEYQQDGNLAILVWQDTKVVVIMSTAHSPAITTTVQRKKGNGSIMDVSCPQAIVEYNKNMGGVDWGDQHRKYYQKSHESYKYIF